jgi:hypothetical protein
MINQKESILKYLKPTFEKYLVPGLIEAYFVWEDGHEYLEYCIQDGTYTVITYKQNINKWAAGISPEQDAQNYYESLGLSHEEIGQNRIKSYNDVQLTFWDAYGNFIESYIYKKPTHLIFITHLFTDEGYDKILMGDE